MDNSKTVFEKIWDGRLPSYPVFRSEKHGIQAILDIFPAHPGHLLVIPREPVDHIFELEPHRYLQLFAVGQATARQIKDVLQPLRVMHIVSGYDIPHVHVHLLPSYERGDTESSLLGGRDGRQATEGELAAMQQKLRFSEERIRKLEAQLDRIAAQEHGLSMSSDVRSRVAQHPTANRLK